MKCKNKTTVQSDKIYYWINKNEGKYGGQTFWKGFADDKMQYEILELREFSSPEIVNLCSQVCGKPMIIHTKEDVEAFLIFEGEAIIESEICKKYLPDYMVPYIRKTGHM